MERFGEHPLQFAIVTRDRAVREFQVVNEERGLRVLVVAAGGAGPGASSGCSPR